jgi:hypothetical protein
MFPPFSALVAVEKAWPIAGATPKQPIIGSSGSTKFSRPGGGSCNFTLRDSRSISQSALSGAGNWRAASGSTTFAASDYGLSAAAASHLMGQVVRYHVGNVFDPAYTMVCLVEKRWLPKPASVG